MGGGHDGCVAFPPSFPWSVQLAALRAPFWAQAVAGKQLVVPVNRPLARRYLCHCQKNPLSPRVSPVSFVWGWNTGLGPPSCLRRWALRRCRPGSFPQVPSCEVSHVSGRKALRPGRWLGAPDTQPVRPAWCPPPALEPAVPSASWTQASSCAHSLRPLQPLHCQRAT